MRAESTRDLGEFSVVFKHELMNVVKALSDERLDDSRILRLA